MKTLIVLFVCIFVGSTHAQVERLKSELNVDSLVTAHLGFYSDLTGNPILLSTNEHPTIAFFEIQYMDSIEKTEESSLAWQFYSRPARSLVQLLSFDPLSGSFKKQTVDTLSVNAGGGCHFLEIVDSAALVHHDKSTSLVLLMCHPVRPTCSSMTYYYFKSYAIDPTAPFSDVILERIEHCRYDLYDREQQKKAFQQLKWKQTK